jgi:cbb3-type cytochrome oxidase cytochrome c subunit
LSCAREAREMKKCIIDDKYWEEFSGLKSFENGVKEGDVRYIEDSLYYCFSIQKRTFRVDKCLWGKVRNLSDK